MAFALASVPVLTVVVDCRALNLVTSNFGSHDRISVWLCPVLASTLCGCIIAKVLCVWPYSSTDLLCWWHFCCLRQFSCTVTVCPLVCCCPPVLIPYSWVLVVVVAAVVDRVGSQWLTCTMVYRCRVMIPPFLAYLFVLRCYCPFKCFCWASSVPLCTDVGLSYQLSYLIFLVLHCSCPVHCL